MYIILMIRRVRRVIDVVICGQNELLFLFPPSVCQVFELAFRACERRRLICRPFFSNMGEHNSPSLTLADTLQICDNKCFSPLEVFCWMIDAK